MHYNNIHMSATHGTAPKKSPLENVLEHQSSFLVTFFVVFLLSFLMLAGIEMVPPSLALLPASSPTPKPSLGSATALPSDEGELPVRIEIPSIGVAANVSNPTTTDINALDRELLAGAVRYPGTGELGEKGNVLIFGHSSYLPVVHNKAYKAFNNIQHLRAGDVITVYGESQVYSYEVETVEETNTTEGEIRLDVEGAELTLATCDTFGAKSDRFIVTAKLVDIAKN